MHGSMNVKIACSLYPAVFGSVMV